MSDNWHVFRPFSLFTFLPLLAFSSAVVHATLIYNTFFLAKIKGATFPFPLISQCDYHLGHHGQLKINSQVSQVRRPVAIAWSPSRSISRSSATSELFHSLTPSPSWNLAPAPSYESKHSNSCIWSRIKWSQIPSPN
ncbi:hypothetical protein V8E53_014785 [Lactarius tabidus]